MSTKQLHLCSDFKITNVQYEEYNILNNINSLAIQNPGFTILVVMPNGKKTRVPVIKHKIMEDLLEKEILNYMHNNNVLLYNKYILEVNRNIKLKEIYIMIKSIPETA